MYRFDLLDATGDGGLLLRGDRLVAVDDELRGLGLGALGDVRRPHDRALVLDAQGQVREGQLELELEADLGAAPAPELGRLARAVATGAQWLALVEADAEPRAQQVEQV